MSKAVKAQLEVKTKCEQLQQSLKDLSEWAQEMRQKETRYLQQKNERSCFPPIRSHVDEMLKFAENQNATEMKRSSVDDLISPESLQDAELYNQRGMEFCKRTKEGEDCNMYKERYAQTAIEMITKAIEIDGKNPAYYVNRALCYFNLERYEETIADCDFAISIESGHVEAHYRRMKAFENLGNNKMAHSSCQELLKLSSNAKELIKIKQDMERIETRLREEADKLKLQGNTQLTSKNYTKACDYFTKAIDMFGSEPIYYHSRSLCHFHLKKYDNCLEDCNKAIELNKRYFRPYYQRMRVWEQKGQHHEAIIDCKTFLELVKDDKQRVTAEKDLERLQRTLELKQKTKYFKWSESSKNAALINFIQKPPHLRSKVPLKRIQIIEDDSTGDRQFTPSNYVVASDYETIPDDVIDKMFNNNTGERVDAKNDTDLDQQSFMQSMSKLKNYFSPLASPSCPPKDTLQIKNSPPGFSGNLSAGSEETEKEKFVSETKSALQATVASRTDAGLSQTKHEKNMINQGNYQPEENTESIQKSDMTFQCPSTTAKFYQTWINLQKPIDKFEFLKVVGEGPLDKLLGVNLSSAILSEILLLLDQYCKKQNYCPFRILTKIASNSQIEILGLLLTAKDKCCLSNLLKFMDSMQGNGDAVQNVRKRFNI